MIQPESVNHRRQSCDHPTIRRNGSKTLPSNEKIAVASSSENSDRAQELAKTFGGRIELALSGESAHAFSKRAGIPDSTLRKYLAGTMPGVGNLLLLAKTLNVTLDWLVTGAEPMHPLPPSISSTEEGRELLENLESSIRRALGTEIVPPDFRLIPRLNVQPAAGSGAVVEAEDPVEMLAFRADWLRRRGIHPQMAHVLTARGDSMEPTIRDGDILLVDTSIDQVRDNAIYVVVYAGRTLVKRVQLRRDGSVVLSSDNKGVFDDEEVPAAEVPELAVAGRVMWYGRSI